MRWVQRLSAAISPPPVRQTYYLQLYSNLTHTNTMILYLVGLVCAIWCVLDVFKKNIILPWKLIVSVLVLGTSWVGLAVYYFLVRQNIEKWLK